MKKTLDKARKKMPFSEALAVAFCAGLIGLSLGVALAHNLTADKQPSVAKLEVVSSHSNEIRQWDVIERTASLLPEIVSSISDLQARINTLSYQSVGELPSCTNGAVQARAYHHLNLAQPDKAIYGMFDAVEVEHKDDVSICRTTVLYDGGKSRKDITYEVGWLDETRSDTYVRGDMI